MKKSRIVKESARKKLEYRRSSVLPEAVLLTTYSEINTEKLHC